MHELTVTQSLLDIALRHAEKAEAKKIAALYLVIGQMASIVDDSVEFYWDMIAKDTIAEGAKLHFRRIPTVFLCLDCNNQFSPSAGMILCPSCNSSHLKIVSGEEFYVEAIDIT